MIARLCCFTALALIAATTATVAAPAKKQAANDGGTFLIQSFGDWGAYTSGKDKAKLCYAMSQPKERTPKGLSRDPAFIFISDRGAGRSEMSVIMGYPLKPGVIATATVGADKYDLLTKDKSAWLKEANEEKEMVASLRSGTALIVKGTSVKGNDTTDRYSLNGASSAIERMQKECQ